MKKNTLYFTVLIVAAALACTGCGFQKKEKANQTDKNEITTAVSKDSAEGEETEEAEQTEEPERENAEENAIHSLHPNLVTERTQGSVEEPERPLVTYFLQTGGITLNKAEARIYPELNQALADAADSLKNRNASVLEELREDAISEIEYAQYNEELKVEYQPQVVRADSSVLSYELFYEDYFGGVHGYEAFEGQTFDVKTGKLLDFYDVITEEHVARSALADALRKQCADSDGLIENNTPEDDADFFFESLKDKEYSGSVAWTLGPDRLNIYYNPYNVGSFSLGIVHASLLFTEYPDVVKPQYQEAPSGYAIHMEGYTGYLADIYNNGNLVNVNVNYADGMDYSYSGIEIQLQDFNGQTTSRVMDVDIYFDMDVYYVRVEDRHFIHVFINGEDDWTGDYVYEITNGQIESCGYVTGRPTELFYDYSDQGDYSVFTKTTVAYTDPQDLSLTKTLNALSTYSASRHYSVGKTGLPESEEPYRPVMTEITPTVKTELTVKVTDASGQETGKTEVLPAGTVLRFYMTDDQTYMIFRYGDEKYGKVSMDNSDWPTTINGQELEQVLDGTMFAG